MIWGPLLSGKKLCIRIAKLTPREVEGLARCETELAIPVLRPRRDVGLVGSTGLGLGLCLQAKSLCVVVLMKGTLE